MFICKYKRFCLRKSTCIFLGLWYTVRVRLDVCEVVSRTSGPAIFIEKSEENANIFTLPECIFKKDVTVFY